MPTDLARRRAELLAWYRRAHRDLPWRRTTDPWRIWVSEIMLQQTRVETALRFYERFLERFPDLATLAGAPVEDVLTVWSGLGYYRRARFLHQGARLVLDRHGGRFPRDVASARELPGIGRSTAGAIVSIAFGTRAAVLDGNVKRVLARLLSIDLADGAPLERALWPVAEELADSDAAGDVNQALMELGATTCPPYPAARCEVCPWQRTCAARAAGRVSTLPRARPKPALRSETWAVAIVRRGHRLLVRQRPSHGLLHDLFELPTFEVGRGEASRASCASALERGVRDAIGARIAVGAELLLHRQVISNRRVAMRVFAASTSGAGPVRPPARFIEPAALDSLPITMATRRIAGQLGALSRKPSAAAARATAAATSRMRPKKR
jgi:A/G-specific adenine glycosylase